MNEFENKVTEVITQLQDITPEITEIALRSVIWAGFFNLVVTLILAVLLSAMCAFCVFYSTDTCKLRGNTKRIKLISFTGMVVFSLIMLGGILINLVNFIDPAAVLVGRIIGTL